MEQFTITKEWLLNNRTARGGYTKQQASILLQTWPLKKGWQKKVIGNKIIIGMKEAFEDAKTPNKKQVLTVLTIDNCLAYLFKNMGKMNLTQEYKLSNIKRNFID